MRRSIATATAAAVAAMAAPAAQAATLGVDPAQRCYRESQTVHLPGSGFSANAQVDFSLNGASLPVKQPILADPAGGLDVTLVLPGLDSGQRRLSYLATDTANPANTAQAKLLMTATDVIAGPDKGRANRPLSIRARGFFGGKRLWAHVVRRGARPSHARNVPIGKVKGACRKVRARKRVFPASPARGRYRVQFDTFRRYSERRAVKFTYGVRIVTLAERRAGQPGQLTVSANGPDPALRRTVSVTVSTGRLRHHSMP